MGPQMVLGVGGAFQVPVLAPRGSVILWLSSTLHSAKVQDPPGTLDLPRGIWTDWRCVVYGECVAVDTRVGCTIVALGDGAG